MKSPFKSLFFASLLLISQNSFAKYFVEPHGAFILSGSNSASSASSYTGPAYGIKVGYYEKEFGFNYGADLTRSTYSYSSQTSSSAQFTKNDLGVFFGYNSQNRYRFWAGGYYTKSSVGSNYYTSGHTYEFGAGYSVSAKVSLNAYYRLPNFTKYTSNGTATTLSPAQSYSEMAVGVSFPLEM